LSPRLFDAVLIFLVVAFFPGKSLFPIFCIPAPFLGKGLFPIFFAPLLVIGTTFRPVRLLPCLMMSAPSSGPGNEARRARCSLDRGKLSTC
jgi:hypothetical protein